MTQDLYWFRPPLWCNTLLQFVVWWIASGADEEQYKGRTASRGSVLGWCDELLGEFSRLSLCVLDANPIRSREQIDHREREATELTLAVHRTSSRTAPREAVLPLYCSSSAPEAIHHTTHWSRVLHHNGGLNQYKSCVPCVFFFLV